MQYWALYGARPTQALSPQSENHILYYLRSSTSCQSRIRTSTMWWSCAISVLVSVLNVNKLPKSWNRSQVSRYLLLSVLTILSDLFKHTKAALPVSQINQFSGGPQILAFPSAADSDIIKAFIDCYVLFYRPWSDHCPTTKNYSYPAFSSTYAACSGYQIFPSQHVVCKPAVQESVYTQTSCSISPPCRWSTLY